jgi:hypothetical protein
MVFNSVYEMFNPLTEVRKQHFWDWFSGDSLNARWTEFNAIGSGTGVIQDDVDEGYRFTHSATMNDWGGIAFDNIRQYAHDGSIIIGIVKEVYGAGTGGYHFGFTGTLDTTQDQISMITSDPPQSPTNFGLQTNGAGSQTTTVGSVAHDENWHTMKIELSSTDSKSYIDGVLDVTKSTNPPTSEMQPSLYGIKRTTDSGDYISIRYCEAYNT